MRCLKLVFDFKNFFNNIGCIIVSIFFILIIIFMIIYIIKGITPLKISISKVVFEDKNKDYNVNSLITFSSQGKINKKKNSGSKSMKNSIKKRNKINIKFNNTKESKKDLLYPPKRGKIGITEVETKVEKENIKLKEIIKKKKFGKLNRNIQNNKKNKKNTIAKEINQEVIDFDIKSIKSDKAMKRKSIIDYQKEREIRMKKVLPLMEQTDKKLLESEIKDDNNKEINIELKKHNKIKKIKKEKEKEKEEKFLDDYELNHLNYEDALNLDKREFYKIYWSIIKRDQLILFTFASWNDYNLFYVKIVRFIFVILTIMVMNVFLFSDKSIHILYINGVKYDFIQRILQIILAAIITHVMEILLCFFTLTDRYIYEIKSLPKIQASGDTTFKKLKRMRMILIIFFAFVVLFTLFYWYFISAFCAVYPNTQKIYLIDCCLSLLLFLIDPFIVYAITTFLRIISLKSIIHKKLKWLYIISRLFPIF